jgi:protein-disulfide isomerase
MSTKKERHEQKLNKKSGPQMWVGLAGILIVLAIGAWFFARPSEGVNESVGTMADLGAVPDEWGMGNPEAKLRIVEFGDYQCPACGYYHPIVKGIMEEFSDDVYFVFRHFPLVNAHQFATMAASAAEAAGRQGKYWEMHDLIMSNQQTWSRGMASSTFLRYARELGLNDVQFQQDVRNPEILAKIERDFNTGIQLNINSVPSFFFNGVLVQTPRSPEAFRELVIQYINAE